MASESPRGRRRGSMTVVCATLRASVKPSVPSETVACSKCGAKVWLSNLTRQQAEAHGRGGEVKPICTGCFIRRGAVKSDEFLPPNSATLAAVGRVVDARRRAAE